MPTATPETPKETVSRDEFERIFRENYENFYRYAVAIFKSNGSRYVSVSGRAEEAVQEMFAFAWANQDRMAQAPSLLGWLYTVLQFKVREMLREDRVWIKRMLQISDQYDEQDAHDFRLKTELEDILEPEDYLLLKRLYLDGYTYNEICASMGVKKSALAMRVKRIKEGFISEYMSGEKKLRKPREQSPLGGQYVVEEVLGDGT